MPLTRCLLNPIFKGMTIPRTAPLDHAAYEHHERHVRTCANFGSIDGLNLVNLFDCCTVICLPQGLYAGQAVVGTEKAHILILHLLFSK